MTDYDAIVVGAGHNGLTAAAVLQRAGLRTLCLEANTYSGGMAATVELMDGFHFEIAGSVQFPTAPRIAEELGLNTLPTVDADVMSVNIGESGEEPMVFYRDPMQLMTHLGEKHGVEAVTGMAELYAWSQGPARALGRFEVCTPPETLDQMYASATNEAERRAIHEMLFGTAMDPIDRFLPDKDKHAVLRGMLAFLAINSTYRGPYTPGSATCLAFALAVPDGSTAMMTKLEGGIGALTDHVRDLFVSAGGELRFRAKVDKIVVEDGRAIGVQLRDGTKISAPVVVSNLAPDTTLNDLVGAEHLPADLVTRLEGRDHRATFVQMHFALDGLPEFAPPYELLNEPGMQQSIGIFGSPEEQQRQWEMCTHGLIPDNPSLGMQIPSCMDSSLAPPGKHAASAYAYAFPVEASRDQHGHLKNEMAQRVIDKITRFAPNFKDILIRHITFAPYHMQTMFAAPSGDFCHGLLQPELMGPNRPGPKGFIDLPIAIDGLYLGGAGCHGGPGITFIPGYNAARQALEDLSA
ncbi:dehydrogenase [Mycobacterium bohemicum DSM 44277]|uniref:Pyridine nucleotide-disulfide oxidoreductase domain-containing protein 2 n=2 Tax=Mycobacterium bohemicum TaxID=56425 RepID=A0A1X1R2R9_MYCBE|nr:NAD(P)/FAD-dependent oxidoreductase [Mycobacterium bohemicum]MCV6970733.1 NAD(P)/FAD-dependent oxidoreductase [Mycobacterium bohemicum]ORU98545.1 dehydrogenase [Mycobacterium bohemicum]CPR08720.1 dehydrogenase [Mycobacterium bohemicum DSM 44277]